MLNTQSNDTTNATQESPEWINVTINRSSSAPPPVVKKERHSPTPESDAQRIARNATPTSPAYSGSPKREVAHASMNWTDCTNDGCQIHLSEKQRSGWYPQCTRRLKKPSVAHDHDWRQEMEANPGKDWVPQQPRRRRAQRAHHEITSWEPCFNDNCNDHQWEKVDAGYYPPKVGEKSELSKQDRSEHKKRRAVRTRLGSEGSDKPFRTWKPSKDKSHTSEANSIALPKSLWQKTTTSNCSIRRKRNSKSQQSMQTEDAPNRGYAVERRSLASWDRCKRGKGANVTNGD